MRRQGSQVSMRVAIEESWEHNKEVSEAEPGGSSLGDSGPPEESGQEMMAGARVWGSGGAMSPRQ